MNPCFIIVWQLPAKHRKMKVGKFRLENKLSFISKIQKIVSKIPNKVLSNDNILVLYSEFNLDRASQKIPLVNQGLSRMRACVSLVS